MNVCLLAQLLQQQRANGTQKRMHVKDQHGANLTITGKATQCLITDQFNSKAYFGTAKKEHPPQHTHTPTTKKKCS
jgi:hypothetical protein